MLVKKLIKSFSVLPLVWLFSLASYGQSNVNLKFFGVSLHPKGEINAPLMPLNPDKKGYLVFNLGGALGYEHFLRRDKFSVKAIQALYADCALQVGGFSHVGVRWVVFKKGRHSLNGGIGPTLVFRRNWYRLKGYQYSGFFRGDKNDRWQYRLIPLAGELEYNLMVSERYELSTGLIPGYPSLISISFGLRRWINP
ncbi:hypothetical protein [Rufibacter sp. LB8]|nr:hypothetical protein [Rufibacter sp. LB8]